MILALIMALMCLYGFFGDETWLPEAWRGHPMVGVTVATVAGVGGEVWLRSDPALSACWAFSCLLAYIGATRPGWKA